MRCRRASSLSFQDLLAFTRLFRLRAVSIRPRLPGAGNGQTDAVRAGHVGRRRRRRLQRLRDRPLLRRRRGDGNDAVCRRNVRAKEKDGTVLAVSRR